MESSPAGIVSRGVTTRSADMAGARGYAVPDFLRFFGGALCASS
jgi:hypothetical protein